MVTPSINAMALYLCSWLHDPQNPTPFLEEARETVSSARETFARRGMTIDDSLRLSYEEGVAADGLDQELLAWATRTATALDSGSLPRDPEHRDAPSSHSYRGFQLTYGDLEEIYGADLPDGS
ncbi:hypothetical protein [Streptomyces tagetis]|uniref:Uncharacterized protein n=1 Tax=Streptomyces tagetis TaxID=2820809 RepID=A0A940XG03_9ACTN|nr:hypothetical protein [Streptomyces sp. RG38]MBQ0827656.1 hypothetical protein [Streptomyces sp. RG38]